MPLIDVHVICGRGRVTKWEYRTAQVTHDWGTDYSHSWGDDKTDLSQWLDSWGDEGWELVCIWSSPSGVRGIEYWATFKHPIDEEKPQNAR